MWLRSEGQGVPIVLLHGWMMDHGDEHATFDAMLAERGLRRIYLDMPGMGSNAGMALPDDLDGYADRLAGAIRDELGEDPFLISGTSAGALIACGIAARLADQVGGMLLRVPLVHGPDERRRVGPVLPLHRDPALLDGLTRRERVLLAGAPLIQRRDWINALLEKMEHRVIPAMRRADRKRLQPIRTDPVRYDLRRVVDSFERPALIMVARQDDNVGWQDAVARFSNWPRATLAVLDAAGHQFPLTHQMPLARALVTDWLDRIELAP